MTEKLFADDPISNRSEDRLDRDLFAKQVSEVCKNVAKESSSSVVALVGPWGSGKSSILSLVADHLKHDKWAVAEFNPWLLSDVESLMRSFFDEVIQATPVDKSGRSSIREKLGGYAKAVSPLGAIGGIVGVDGSAAIEKVGQLIQGDQSLTKKRDDLVNELEKLKKPVLIILDDLDRLYPEELLMIFKLVRLVGRLPNLHYLLSYDEKTLLDVISQTELSKGDTARARSYLEKIVQVKLDLPRMNSYQQLMLVNSAHDEVLKRNNITLSEEDQSRTSSAYVECMVDYLNQPRAIKRFFGQIEALYPLVAGETNFADFTLLTFLRTFEPGVYQLIVDHKQELTGASFAADFKEESNTDRKKRWIEFIKETTAGNAEELFDLVSHLFIPLMSARHNTNYGNSTAKDFQLQKRVGNADYFDRYFVFGVPEDDISDTKINALVKKLGESKNENEATRGISELIDKDAVLALRKLRDIQGSAGISPKPLLAILASKYLTLKHKEGFFSIPPEWAMQDMVKKAIPAVPDAERQSVFEATAATLHGLLMLIHTYVSSDENKQEPLAEKLRQAMVDALKKRMEELATKDLKDFSNNDFNLFYPYKTLVGNKELTEWLWAGVKSHTWNPIDVLAHLVSEATSYGSTGTKKTIGQLDSDALDNYFGLDELLTQKEDEIKAVDLTPDGSDGFSYREEPTFENKKNYVLRLLRNRYDARNKEQTSD